jgi:hypothetical protein
MFLLKRKESQPKANKKEIRAYTLLDKPEIGREERKEP